MSILDKSLMTDLFPAVMAAKSKQSETDSHVDEVGNNYTTDKRDSQVGTPLRTEQEEQSPVKEKAQPNIFLYKAEDLKQKYNAVCTLLINAGLSYSVTHDLPPRVYIHGGHSIEERESFMERLRNEPEAEALLILKAANTDAYLREAIEERAGIREYDAGLSGSLFLAVLGDISHEKQRREFQPNIKPISWKDELKLMGIE